MRPAAPVRILVAAAALAALLIALVVRENAARAGGVEVRLALAGYDPRSLLQGHYVRFDLMHRLPAGARCPPGAGREWPGADDAWVALRREGDHHAPVAQTRTRAEALRIGEIAVRGGLLCLDLGPSREALRVQVNLGVDRLHLDQDAAEALERDLRRVAPDAAAPGYAVLSVGRDGKARVKGLVVGKRRVDLDWW